MKKMFFLTTALAISACLCQATTLIVGSPNDNNYAGDTLSPRFGTLINFDNLTPNPSGTPVPANEYVSQGIQSITSNSSADPLVVYPYSSQTAPNYLSTSDGFGGITITLSNTVNIIGIGVLESDGLADTLTALGANGNVLGQPFVETVPMTGNTPFSAYYVITDTTLDIKSLVVSSASGNFGVDDLQFAPEPMNLALVGGGLLSLLGLARSRKSKANLQA